MEKGRREREGEGRRERGGERGGVFLTDIWYMLQLQFGKFTKHFFKGNLVCTQSLYIIH